MTPPETAGRVGAPLVSTAGARVLWERYRAPVQVYALSRLLVFACTAFAVWLRRPPFGIVQALGASDGAWYVGIAVYGYPTEVSDVLGVTGYSSFPFFPVLPLAIRAVSLLTGMPALVAAVVLVNVCGLLSAVLLWELTRQLASVEVADRATRLFCFFPGSVVLSMVYAEPLFITLALVCLLALRSQHWVVAGLAAGVASGTRQQGLALGLVCLGAAIHAIRTSDAWRSLLCVVLAPFGVIGYFLFLWYWTGTPSVWLQARAAWAPGQQGGGPAGLLRLLADSPYGELMGPLAIGGLIWVGVTATIAVRKRVLDQPTTVYLVAILASILLFTGLGPQPRYLLTAFPLMVPLAAWMSPRAARLLTGFFSALLALTTTMYTSGIGALP